eukprot:2453839-Pyramimonas_sp.AAC.1
MDPQLVFAADHMVASGLQAATLVRPLGDCPSRVCAVEARGAAGLHRERSVLPTLTKSLALIQEAYHECTLARAQLRADQEARPPDSSG